MHTGLRWLGHGLAACALLALLAVPAMAKVYRYKTLDGRWVITDKPPPIKTELKPDHALGTVSSPQEPSSTAPPVPSLRYVEKKAKGWRYQEVESIPETIRLQIFCDLDRVQQRTGDAEGAYGIIAGKYALPIDAVNAIAGEEALLQWWPFRCR